VTRERAASSWNQRRTTLLHRCRDGNRRDAWGQSIEGIRSERNPLSEGSRLFDLYVVNVSRVRLDFGRVGRVEVSPASATVDHPGWQVRHVPRTTIRYKQTWEPPFLSRLTHRRLDDSDWPPTGECNQSYTVSTRRERNGYCTHSPSRETPR
jgi:hypothetical protein